MMEKKRGGMTAEEFLELFEKSAKELDVQASYKLARELEQFRSEPVLGYRTAGSRAEADAGDFLYRKMCEIGLKTEKHPVVLDGWEFFGATLRYQTEEGERCIRLGGYQTEMRVSNLQTELVDAGKGTEKDFLKTDVRGKIALIRINHRKLQESKHVLFARHDENR